jgi:hypothetical protein
VKATKYEVKIEMQVLSIDVVESLLCEVIRNINNESINGSIEKDDGDAVEWNTQSTSVEF